MSTEQNYGGKGSYANPTSQTVKSDQQTSSGVDNRPAWFGHHHSSLLDTVYLSQFDRIRPEEYHRTMLFNVNTDLMSPQINEGDAVLAVFVNPADYRALSGVVAVGCKGFTQSVRLGRVGLMAHSGLTLLRDNSGREGEVNVPWDDILFLAKVKYLVHGKAV